MFNNNPGGIFKKLNTNKKFILGIVTGMVISSVSVYSAANIIASKNVSYSSEYLEANNVQDAVDELYCKATDYTALKQEIEQGILNKTYPVGSIYISATLSTTSQVAQALGGTWEVYGSGRTLISANSTYPINTTGGSATHQHKYGFQYAGYYREVLLEGVADTGVLNYSGDTNYSIASQSVSVPVASSTIISANSSTTGSYTGNIQANRYLTVGNTSTASSLMPYITVYMYKRTA